MAERELRIVEQQLVQANDDIANLCVGHDQMIKESRTLEAAHQTTADAVVFYGNEVLFFASLHDRMSSCLASKAMPQK